MNRSYYGRIYLNPHPSPLDMSMLDNDEYLHNENGYHNSILTDTAFQINSPGTPDAVLFETTLTGTEGKAEHDRWLKVESNIKANGGREFAFKLWCQFPRIRITCKPCSSRLFRQH